VALETEQVLVALGLVVVAGFLAHLAFIRFRLPEVLLLIGFGVLIGPTFHLVDIEFFAAVTPLAGTVAIILILFDGGLEINIKELRGGVALGSVLAIIVFTLTAILCAGIAHIVAGIPSLEALLLGMAFGGAGVVIVIPLIQHMGVLPRTVTLVSIEGAVSDVLVIIGIYSLSTAIVLREADPTEFASHLMSTIALGVAAGLLMGFLWASVLGRFRERSYEYILTLAALFLTYIGIEHFEGSGPLAVLVFGLVIGNKKAARTHILEADETGRAVRKTRRKMPVFGEELENFHAEVTFLVRAFFFTALGVVLDMEVMRNPRFLAVGCAMALMVALARWAGVKMLFFRSDLPAWDRFALAIMFPLGLAAAALSLVPYQQFGIEAARDFGSYAAVVIILTNVFSALLVFMASIGGWKEKMEQPARARAQKAR
jgi:cell volume regulation protein A